MKPAKQNKIQPKSNESKFGGRNGGGEGQEEETFVSFLCSQFSPSEESPDV